MTIEVYDSRIGVRLPPAGKAKRRESSSTKTEIGSGLINLQEVFALSL
jgi:hypothetical protein